MIVTDGLKPGERVVSEGVSKVGPGSVVKPQLENPQEASR
jgi:hypothetical protein